MHYAQSSNMFNFLPYLFQFSQNVENMGRWGCDVFEVVLAWGGKTQCQIPNVSLLHACYVLTACLLYDCCALAACLLRACSVLSACLLRACCVLGECLLRAFWVLSVCF